MNSFLSVGPTGPTTGGGVTETFVDISAIIESYDFYVRSSTYLSSTTSRIVIFSQIFGSERQKLDTYDEDVVQIMARIVGDTDILGGNPYSIYGGSTDGGEPDSVYGPSDFVDGGSL